MFLKDSWLCFLTRSWFLFPKAFLPRGKGRSPLWKKEDVMKGDGLQGRKRRGKPALLPKAAAETSAEPEVREWAARRVHSSFWAGMRSHAGAGAEESGCFPGCSWFPGSNTRPRSSPRQVSRIRETQRWPA